MAQNSDSGGSGFGPPLGKYGNNSALPGQDTKRAEALRLREALWQWSSIPDVRKCGQVPCTALMPVVEGPNGLRLGGLCRCHSVWVCPVCAPEIRGARGEEIRLAVELHQAGEGGIDFGTATLPHGVGDRLRDSYSVVASAWNSVNSDMSVKGFRRRHGFWGFMRTCEVTHGLNGWHPHVHWLDFWDGPLSASEIAEYRAMVFGAWSRSVVRQGFDRPSEAHGVVLLPVRDGDISDYLTKMSPASAAHELTNLSTKQARLTGVTPFDILRLVRDRGEMPWTGLWWEYEKATRGRRMFGSTPRLFDRLGLSLDDPDVEVGGRVVATVSSEDWGRLRFFFGGVRGVQIVIERAAVSGQIGVNEALRVLMGGAPLLELVLSDGVQLVLGPGDDGGMF
jgi:hypothetical protein